MIRKSDGTDVSVVKYELDEFTLQLTAYADNIIRVTQSGHPFVFADEPMITCRPGGTFTSADEYSASAGKLRFEIDPQTGALRWFNNDMLIMREPEKDGRVLREIDIIRYRYDDASPETQYVSVDGMRSRVEGTPYVDRKGYQTRLSFVFDEDEDIYGLGQHEEGILNYRHQHQFLYQHNFKIVCPVIYSSKCWAVLNNCCGAQIFHDDAFGSYLAADAADELDYFVICGESFYDLLAGIRKLTGDAPLLPKWALGYVQSKEHYHTAEELLAVAQRYREEKIPIDCLVQDWQTWPSGQWGQKTPDLTRYPDFKGLIDKLHEKNIKLMLSVWPNLHGNCPNELELAQKGLMLGNRHTYNAFASEGRATYWKQCNEVYFPAGLDAWWCDCTEPFEFDWRGRVKMSPENRWQLNVGEFKRYIDPAKVLAYSIYHSQALYEGQRGVTDEKRVVNLTRSGLTGQQRYSTICWNGDTCATWDVLRKTVPDGLNYMLGGMPYWTVDAGAFFVKYNADAWFMHGDYENGPADEEYCELYLRWMQLSAFLPMMRSHGMDFPREVWQFGKKGEYYYEGLCDIIRLRYMLLPYLYSEMADVHFGQSTMVRMLAFDFLSDKKARNLTDEFMFGASLLVCPVLSKGSKRMTEREVYLPEGCAWYDFWTHKRYAGGQTLKLSVPFNSIPLFVKEGSILPMIRPVQSTAESDNAPVTLFVFAGADAKLSYYSDAGDGYGYEKGEYLFTDYVWEDKERRLTCSYRGDKRFLGAQPKVMIID